MRVTVSGKSHGLVLAMRPVGPLRGRSPLREPRRGHRASGVRAATRIYRTPLLPAAARYSRTGRSKYRLDGLACSGATCTWRVSEIVRPTDVTSRHVMDFLNYQGKEIEVVFTQRAAEISERVTTMQVATFRTTSRWLS